VGRTHAEEAAIARTPKAGETAKPRRAPARAAAKARPAAKPKPAAAPKAPAKAAAKPSAKPAARAKAAAPKPRAAPAPKAPPKAKPAARPKATPQRKASAAAATPPMPRPKRARKEKLAPALLDRLVAAAVKSLEDDKAENIVVLDVTGRADYADRLVIATGLADRQIQAMATHLDEAFAKEGLKLRGDAVEASPNWVLISAGDLVVHLFKPETRELYGLERMWGPHSPAPEDDRTPLPDDGLGGSTATEDDDE